VVILDRTPSSSARQRIAKLHLPDRLQNRPVQGAVRVAAVTLTGGGRVLVLSEVRVR
jgi:hypothetical protein